MQLTGNLKAATLIATAVSALLGPGRIVRAAPEMEGEAPRNRIEFAGLLYGEVNRVRVMEPTLRYSRRLGDARWLRIRVGFDAMSGASPSGALPTLQAETYTSPSGNTYEAAAGEQPRRVFRDERTSFALEYEHPVTRTLKSSSGISYSSEADYASFGVSQSLALDFNRRLSTVNLGFSINKDKVTPKGGKGEALTDQVTGPVTLDAEEQKDIWDLQLGLTQIINPNLIAQLNWATGEDSGYMTEPYKGISVFNSTGQFIQVLREKRPDKRQRQTLVTKFSWHLGRDVLQGSYRWYDDDWGVTGHTFDLRYHWKFADGQVLRPHLRFGTQSAADFHTYSLPFAETLPEYASSDMRLAELSTLTFGLKYSRPLLNGLASVRLEYMQQHAPVPDADVPEPLRSLDLNPDLHAVMLSFGYSMDF